MTGLVLGAFGLVLFFLLLPDSGGPVESSSLLPEKLSPVERVVTDTRIQPKAPSQQADTAAAPLSAACRSYLGTVQAFDARAFAAGDDPGALPLVSRDCASLPDRLQQLHANFLEACRRFENAARGGAEQGREEARKDCALAHTFYRAAITDFLTDKQPLAAITDRHVLEDKTIARFSRDAEAAAQAAERLLEVDPNDTSAAEVAATTRLVAALRANQDGPLDATTADRVRQAIERARRLEGSDLEQLAELEYGLESARKLSPDELRHRADEVLAKYPDIGLGHYLRGCAEKKAGNEAQAMREFRRAARAEPQSARYREVVSLAESVREGRIVDVCGMRMGLPEPMLAPRAAR